MNNQQLKAIKEFQEAGKALLKAGLALAGVDATLYVFSYNKFKKAGGGKESITYTFQNIEIIDLDVPYHESAGW